MAALVPLSQDIHLLSMPVLYKNRFFIKDPRLTPELRGHKYNIISPLEGPFISLTGRGEGRGGGALVEFEGGHVKKYGFKGGDRWKILGEKGGGSLKKILKFCNDGICNNANSLPCPKTSVYSDFNRKACRRIPLSLRLWSKTFSYILSVVNFGKRSDVSAYPNFRNMMKRVSLTPNLSNYLFKNLWNQPFWAPTNFRCTPGSSTTHAQAFFHN